MQRVFPISIEYAAAFVLGLALSGVVLAPVSSQTKGKSGKLSEQVYLCKNYESAKSLLKIQTEYIVLISKDNMKGYNFTNGSKIRGKFLFLKAGIKMILRKIGNRINKIKLKNGKNLAKFCSMTEDSRLIGKKLYPTNRGYDLGIWFMYEKGAGYLSHSHYMSFWSTKKLNFIKIAIYTLNLDGRKVYVLRADDKWQPYARAYIPGR